MPLAGCLIDKTVELFFAGFVDWAFMSVHSWGENPLGNWTLEVHNDASAHRGNEAKFYTWTLQLFGTEADPNSDIAESGASSNPLENSIPVVRQALKVISGILLSLGLRWRFFLQSKSHILGESKTFGFCCTSF